ncbi:MAG: hypothetical protein ACJAS6_000607 [Rickettsiales bacterium]|jgi:hypothetical protein
MTKENISVNAKFDALINLHGTILEHEKLEEFDKVAEAFRNYLNKAEEIKSYGEEVWPIEKTKRIWGFFTSLIRQIDGDDRVIFYLNCIRQRIKLKEKELQNTEFLEFLECELSWDADKAVYKEVSDEFRELSKKLYKKYPYNPEFQHSYAHILKNEDTIESLELAKKLYRKCLVMWNGNRMVLHGSGMCEYILAKKYAFNREYKKAFDTIKDTREYKFYKDHEKLQNRFLNFRNEVDEIRESNKSIDNSTKNLESLIEKDQKSRKDFESKIKSDMDDKLTEARKSSLEMLGIFSAIIAFIISAVTTTVKQPSLEFAVPLLLSIGIMLILFVLAISIFISNKFLWRSFGVFLIGILILASLFFHMSFSPNTKDDNKSNIEVGLDVTKQPSKKMGASSVNHKEN